MPEVTVISKAKSWEESLAVKKERVRANWDPESLSPNNTGKMKNEFMPLPWSYIHSWIRSWRI